MDGQIEILESKMEHLSSYHIHGIISELRSIKTIIEEDFRRQVVQFRVADNDLGYSRTISIIDESINRLKKLQN